MRGLRGRFADVVNNWWEIMRRQKKLTWFRSGYGQVAIIFPVRRRGAALFLGRDPARRPDADRLGLRPGAGCAVLVRLGLRAACRVESDGRSPDRLPGRDRARSHRGYRQAPASPRATAGTDARRAEHWSSTCPTASPCVGPVRCAHRARRIRAGHRAFGLGQEHAVSRLRRHLALWRRPACVKPAARHAVPAAKALSDDRNVAGTAAYPRRPDAFDDDGLSRRAGRLRAARFSPDGSTSSSTGRRCCLRVSSSASLRARLSAPAAMAVSRRGAPPRSTKRARRAFTGAAEGEAPGHDRGEHRPPPDARRVP